MRYQYYIIGRDYGKATPEYLFRRFIVPVREAEGMWVPAGEPTEETHLYDPTDLILEMEHWQVHADNTAGKLDDMPCPEGWKVMARDWLPEDYVPPAAEELEKRHRDAVEYLRKLGVRFDVR